VFKDKKEPIAGLKKVTISVHCECTIAIHMCQVFLRTNQRTSPKVFEIGISKHSCWLCQNYLEFLSAAWRSRFIIAGYQGKIHSGWKPPPGGPPGVLSSMDELLRQETDEILESVKRKRRSDSYPRESDPENTLLNMGIARSVRGWFS
jgi:OTT_1508-like deaminase